MSAQTWSLIIALIYLPIATFAPGFFMVRRLRLSPVEKITASVAISVFLLYLAGFVGAGMFGTSIPAKCWAGVCVVLALLSTRDILKLWRHPIAGPSLKAFACVVSFALLLAAVVIIPTGGEWGGDLWEHYKRTAVFLGLLPADTTFLLRYTLPSRPPLMNAAAAGVLAIVPFKEYCVGQIAFLYMNTLAFLGCVAVAPQLLKRTRPSPWLLASAMICVPMFWQNCTFLWTKLLTAFFVLASLAFYLTGLRKNCTLRKSLAFACAAAGILAHYSAAPYVLAIAAHYTIVHLRSWRVEVPRALGFLAISLLCLGTWFGFSIHRFGIAQTFGSNTTVTGYGQHGTLTGKIASALENLHSSCIPFFLRGMPIREQESTAGKLRDFGFDFYQITLPGLIGVAWLVALGLLFLQNRARRTAAITPIDSIHAPQVRPRFSERLFWIWMIPSYILMGLLSVPPTDLPRGNAQICLIPVALIAICTACQGLQRMSQPRRVLVALILFCDFVLGVMIHYWVQSIPVRHAVAQDSVHFDWPAQYSSTSMVNLKIKYLHQLPTIHDYFSGATPLLLVLIFTSGVAACVAVVRGQPARAQPRGGEDLRPANG